MSQSSVMPGFRPTIGFTLIYLGLVVLIPLSTLVFKSFALTWDDYVHIITNKRVLSSFRVSFGSALMAASIASVFGFITAWVLVRYSFFGKNIFHALIDLPFALPTAVAGIVLATIFQLVGFWVNYYWILLAFRLPLNHWVSSLPSFLSVFLLWCEPLNRYCWSLRHPWKKPVLVLVLPVYKSLPKLYFPIFFQRY